MDVFILSRAISHLRGKNAKARAEEFRAPLSQDVMEDPTIVTGRTVVTGRTTLDGKADEEGSIYSTVIGWLITVSVSVLSVYLSWSCNTAQNEPAVIKVVYAFFAFLFGWLYLILYFLFFRTSCSIASMKRKGQSRGSVKSHVIPVR